MRALHLFAVTNCSSRWRRIVPAWLRLSVALLSTLGVSNAALAANGTWSSSAISPGSWQTASNWLSSIIPGATSGSTNTDTATFNSTSAFTGAVPDLNRNLENITFDTNAVAYTIGATGGNALLLTSGGTTQIAGTFFGNNIIESINAPLTLEGNYTFADNTTNTGDLLAFGGPITSGAAGTPTLSVSGSGNTTISGAIGGGVGAIGITKNGSGTLTLAGNSANTYSGTTAVNGGTLVLSKSLTSSVTVPGDLIIGPVGGGASAIVQLGISNQIGDSSTVTINSSGLLSIPNGTQDYFPTLVLNGGAVSTGTGPSCFLGLIFNSGQVQTNGSSTTATIGGVLNLNDDSSHSTTFTVASGTTASGIDLDIPALVVAGGIVKSGAGILRLSGANTFSSGLAIQQGTLQINTINNASTPGPLGSNTSITLGTNGQTGTLEYTGGNAASNMPFTLGASGGYIQVDTAGTNLTLSGAITGGGLTKTGAGILTLTGTSSYTGATFVNGGTLLFGSGGSLSTQGAIVVGNATQSSTLTVDGTGAMTQAGTAFIDVGDFSGVTSTLNIGTSANGATVSTGTGGVLVYKTGTAIIGNGSVSGTLTSNGPITVQGGILQVNNGTLNLASGQTFTVSNGGRATFTGAYSSSSGSYMITGTGSKLETLGGNSLTVQNGATFNIQSGGLLSSSGSLIVGRSSTGTVAVDGAGSRLNVGGSSEIGLDVFTGSANGSLTFRNGSTGNVLNNVTVASDGGANATGTISVLSGSTVTAMANLYLFGFTNLSANFTVDGAGSAVSLNSGGSVTVGFNGSGTTGVLNVSNNGIFTLGSGGATTLNPTGAININGGSIDLKTLNYNGGTVNFNSGSLAFLGDLHVGVGGFLGQNLTLDPSKILTLSGTTTVDQFKTLTLSGGTLSTGNLVNNGTFNFTSGTLDITGASGLTIGSGGALGSAVTIGAGSNLNVTGPTVLSSSTATLNVNGGSFSTNRYLQSFGSVTTNGSFAVAQQVLNYSGATIDVTGGSFSADSFNNFGSLILDGGTIALGSNGLTNNAGAYFYIGANKTVSIASASTNAGEIQLGGGSALLTGAGTLTNTGLLHGDGVIANGVTNGAGGEIRAEAGKRIKLSGANGANGGKINLQGGTAEFSQALTNSGNGLIAGRGTLITGGTGLLNQAIVALSSGLTDVFGKVNNSTGVGTKGITVSGNADVTFWDDVMNGAGSLFKVSTGSSATFFGTFGGAGVTGGGQVNFEADVTPGFSPAAVTFGGNVLFDSTSALHLDLGGTTPGNGPHNHDQMNIVGSASLGGSLDLVPYNGFAPVSGDKFTVMTYASESGIFSTVTGTSPAPGLTYNAVYLPTSLVILTSVNGEKTWGVDNNGNSSLGSNWIGGVAPGGVGDTATFSTIITAPRVVTVDADTTVGTLKFDSPFGYTIAGSHTLTLHAAGSAAAAISVSGIHGNGAHTISAPITLASNLNVVQNSTGTLRIAGPLNDAAGKQINISGPGTTAITGQVNLGNGTALSVSGSSTLRLAVTSPATVGTGVAAIVSIGATLELAGSVSALANGPNRVSITNNSNAPGLLVSGTNQVVGGIDGVGTTQVNAGSDLTANHIIQAALVIGGGAGSSAIVTIDASDSNGNPLASGLLLAGSVQPSGPFGAGVSSVSSIGDSANVRSGAAASALGSSSAGASGAAVPEPSALKLLVFAALTLSLLAIVRRRTHFTESQP